MNSDELHQFIQQVVREILVRSPVRIADGASRGLSRIDLLVYLHRAPQESHTKDAHHLNGPSASTSSASIAGRTESRGVLGPVTSSSSSSIITSTTTAAAAAITATTTTTTSTTSTGITSSIGMTGGTGAASGEVETTPAAEDLPISPLTTKEVITVLLKLTRTFDDTTTEFLYGPEEVKGAVRQMMQHGNGLTVPSQLMATLILA
ncbi:uncharacterized protein TM35_000262440, partial [Trypanosoma theileri]